MLNLVKTHFLAVLVLLTPQAAFSKKIKVNLEPYKTNPSFERSVAVNLEYFGFDVDREYFKSSDNEVRELLVKWLGQIGDISTTDLSSSPVESMKLTVRFDQSGIPNPKDVNPKLKNLFELAEVFDHIEGLGDLDSVPRDMRSAYISLLGPYLDEVYRFSLCVVLDHKLNVQKSLKAPIEISNLLHGNCPKTRLLSERLDLYFSSPDSEVKYYDKDVNGNFRDFLASQDIVLFHKFSSWLCPKTSDDMTNFAAAGWIPSYDPLQPLDNLSKCIDFLNGNVFKDMSKTLTAILSDLQISPGISAYHKSFIEESLALVDPSRGDSQGKLEEIINSALDEGIRESGRLLQNRLNSKDFNLDGINLLTGSAKAYSPKEYFIVLFSQNNLPSSESTLKTTLKSKNNKGQLELVQMIKEIISSDCSFSNFNLSCLSPLNLDIHGSEAIEVELLWNSKTVWTKYYYEGDK